MVELVEVVYLVYWARSFFASMDDAKLYRQRLAVTAAMVLFLLYVGHYASKELGAVLCGWAIAVEIVCAVGAVMDLDARLFERQP